MKIEVDRDDLQKVLMLVMDNEHTSASRSGLRHRAENRDEIIKELLFMLELTQEEAENIYLDWRR